jgi:Transposase IS116/IS110/IS902 family
MKTPEPELFRSGRQFAAWIGLTPKDHSTAGKVRLGAIARAGEEALCSVLVATCPTSPPWTTPSSTARWRGRLARRRRSRCSAPPASTIRCTCSTTTPVPDPDYFQNFVIFTNYQFYVDAFARICRERVAVAGGAGGIAFVEPGAGMRSPRRVRP